MRSNSTPVRCLLALFALALVGSTCTRSDKNPAAGGAPPSAAGEDGRLRNGAYAVLLEASTHDSADAVPSPHVVLPYDARYSDADQKEPKIYVAIDTLSWVPFVLEGRPETTPDGKGHTMLSVALSRNYVKRLERFTTEHLGGRVGMVLDGELVTMHKIRSIIREGKVQITRCDDNACAVLYSKLTQ